MEKSNNDITRIFLEIRDDDNLNENLYAEWFVYCKKKFEINPTVNKIFRVEDKEDLFQDIMFYIWINRMKFDPTRVVGGRKTSFSAWLCRIIETKCRDYFREFTVKNKEGNHIRKEFCDIEEYQECITAEKLIVKTNFGRKELNVYGGPADVCNVENDIIKGLESAMIHDALRALNERYAKAVKLYYFEDCTEKEIAEKMGTTVNAVKKILFRARKNIQNLLEEAGYTKEAA